MKTLILFDSFYGNTEKTAEAMKKGLTSFGEVTLLRLNKAVAGMTDNFDLLIIGSPTRAFNPTKDAKSFLKKLPPRSLEGKMAAAFDTRISLDKVDSKFLTFMAGIFGYAAEPMLKIMLKKGAKAAAEAEGFFVEGTEGPMTQGELERASSWAASFNLT